MLNVNLKPARSLQKSYKAIITEVKTNKKPVILTTNDKPQAAIISLEDLKTLNAIKINQGALDMLKLAVDNKEELRDLPADLRKKANKILYTK